MSKTLLQAITLLLAFISIVTGILELFGLSNPELTSISSPPNKLLDTNLRFLSGVWLATGISIFRILPSIEKEIVMFRTIWGMIFLGGIGRILSILFVGFPPVVFILVAVLEILGAPLFICWQNQVARSSNAL